jgi:tripartite-type tricarboxylate transporter receptor subunit TctC
LAIYRIIDMISLKLLLTAMLIAFAAPAALAQAYPTKPIRFIVGFLPGGGSDIFARLIAQSLTERMGQQVVVENRPGAGGTIATEAVVRSAPDGYTLLQGSPSEISINPELYAKLAFDPRKELVPVSMYASTPLVLVVHPSLPVKSVKEMIALAKARPGEMNYGSAGSGSMTHLAAALFVSGAGTNIVHVPYKGLGGAVPDLVAGQVQMITAPVPVVISLIQAGRLKPLGVTSAARSKMLPDVPTISEGGVKGYEVTQWYGPFAHAATPREIVSRLHGELAQALRSPETVGRIAKQGAEPGNLTLDELTQLVKVENAKWTKAVKTSGAKIE